jgi:hypothetical protein
LTREETDIASVPYRSTTTPSARTGGAGIMLDVQLG